MHVLYDLLYWSEALAGMQTGPWKEEGMLHEGLVSSFCITKLHSKLSATSIVTHMY